MVKVLIVDDHAVFRAGLHSVLAGVPELEVVAEAADGDEALAAVAAHHPDVVLMDLHLPGTGGLEATARIAADHPTCAVLALTMLDDGANVRAAIRAGARGYLVKDSSLDDIVRAVQAVAAGQIVLGGGVAAHALSGQQQSGEVELGLTDRELQLAKLLVRGATTGQMAAALGISAKTVRNHLSNIYTKLGAQDRGQVVLALQQVLEPPRRPTAR